MKILFINEKYNKIGGISSYLTSTEKALNKKGIETFFFCLSKDRSYKKGNTYIYNCKDYKNWIDFLIRHNYFDIKLYKQLRKYIKKINPNIIHLQNIWASPYTFLRACKGFKTIQTIHDYKSICPTNWYIKKSNLKICTGDVGIKCWLNSCIKFSTYLFDYKLSLNKIALFNKYINLFICPSKKLKFHIEKHGFKNTAYLPYSIDIDLWKQKSKKIMSDKIIYVGRLEKEKGIFWLVKAFSTVIKKIPSAELIIIGKGKEETNLKIFIKKLKLEKAIEFKGALNHSIIIKSYKDACISIVPSIYMEQFGITMIESMAMETPVIGSDIGGIPELIENDINGYLINVFDTKNLAEKMIFLLKNKKIAVRMGKEGRKKIEKNFDIENNIDNLISEYNQIIKK